MKLILNRISQDDTQTIGLVKVIGSGKVQEFCTVELSWKDNQRSVSCIPAGMYGAEKIDDHPKFGRSLLIYGVEGRDGIMMHAANHYHQLKGCIAPGNGFTDIDHDGHVDVVQSRAAMNAICDLLPRDFVFEIHDTVSFEKKFTETGESMGVS